MLRSWHVWRRHGLKLGALIVALGALAFGIGTQTAQAQGYGARVPGGTWTQVCRNGFMDGRFLFRANCLNKDGEWRDGSLDMRQCPSWVVSSQGAYLQCGYGPSTGGRAVDGPWRKGREGGYGGYGGYRGGDHGGAYGGYDLPAGPWRNECRNAWIEDGYLLRASCLNRKQEWRDASLDLRTCSRFARVYSDGAYLKCD